MAITRIHLHHTGTVAHYNCSVMFELGIEFEGPSSITTGGPRCATCQLTCQSPFRINLLKGGRYNQREIKSIELLAAYLRS